MMFGSDGASASAPTEPVGCPSKIGAHVRPKSSVFQTPPLFGAMKNTFGWSGMPAIATVRPARNGPMQRQRNSLYGTELSWEYSTEAANSRTKEEMHRRSDIWVFPRLRSYRG